MKTFVIKLAGVVDDDSLMRLGELRMSITPVSGQSTQRFFLSTSEHVTLDITGDGTFTENNTKKLELDAVTNKRVEVTNGTFYLSILNKEAVTKLSFFEDYSHNFHSGLNLSQLRTMKNLTVLDTERGGVNGNVEDLAGLTQLENLKLQGANITGSLAVIGENLVNLTSLQSLATRVAGDTSTFGNLTQLTDLRLYDLVSNTSKLSDFSSLTTLTRLEISNGSSGDISALAGLTNLTRLTLSNNATITGATSSLAALHPNNGGKLATFSYSNTGITGTWPPS